MEDEASVWPAIEGALGPRSSEACGLANCRCAVESARGCPRRGPYPITGRCINIVLHVLQYPRVVHRTPPKLLHSCTAQATQHLPFPRAHGLHTLYHNRVDILRPSCAFCTTDRTSLGTGPRALVCGVCSRILLRLCAEVVPCSITSFLNSGYICRFQATII